MVSNSLTLESSKVSNLRPELESLITFESFSTFWGQNQLFKSYFCLLSACNHCLQANFQAFLLFFSKTG